MRASQTFPVVFLTAKLHVCFREESFITVPFCGCMSVSTHTVRSLDRGSKWGGFDLVSALCSREIAQERFLPLGYVIIKAWPFAFLCMEVTCEMAFRNTNVMWSLPLEGDGHSRQLVSGSGWVKMESLLKWHLAYFRFYPWLQGGVFSTVLIRLRCAELWKDVIWRGMVLVLLGSFCFQMLALGKDGG